jgi:hypothetical protein
MKVLSLLFSKDFILEIILLSISKEKIILKEKCTLSAGLFFQ